MRLQIAAAFLFLTSALHSQWEMQDAHVTADLRGIDYVGGGVAWASGSHGTVLRTEDMGFVWQLCATPPDAKELDFRGVQAFDNDTAIVMSSGPGDKSRLYKTTDGCQTWKLLFTNPDKHGFWDAIVAHNSESISVLGDPVQSSFVVRWTQDNGKTWHIERSTPVAGNEGAFAASNSSLIVDEVDGPTIFGTGGPGGANLFEECGTSCKKKGTFVPRNMPMFPRSASAGIFSLAYKAADNRVGHHFVAVGGDYKLPDERRGTAAYTVDDGTESKWRAAETFPHGYRSAVAYDAKANTWITVGPNGTDISTDDGRKWRPLKPGPGDAPDADKNWNALSLPFVIGPNGRIGILRDAALHAP